MCFTFYFLLYQLFFFLKNLQLQLLVYQFNSKPIVSCQKEKKKRKHESLFPICQ